MDAWLALIDKYGLPIAGIVALAVFAWWATRKLIAVLETRNSDLAARNDRTLDISERQVAATAELTKVIHQALDSRDDLVRLLERVLDQLGKK